MAASRASDATPELFGLRLGARRAGRGGGPDRKRRARGQSRCAPRRRHQAERFGLGARVAARARSRNEGEAAEASYLDAIARLRRTPLRPELARAHHLYGEWLRREGRRVDARENLRSAHEMFVAIGMKGFAERAGRELLATGESVRRRSDELTPHKEQIARLARDGLSNPEIAAS